MPRLPTEILEKIVLEANDIEIAKIFRKYITQYVFDKMEKNVLVYGQIQSGKTNEIIRIIKNDYRLNIVVVQNSLLVLEQYSARFASVGVPFQVINNTTKEIIEKNVIIMNNKWRYKCLDKALSIPRAYTLILDEADTTVRTCPLVKDASKIFYITATPFGMNVDFDTVIKLKAISNYKSINDLQVHSETEEDAIDKFLATKSGIMLINTETYIDGMTSQVNRLRKVYKKVPIVLLSTKKYVWIGGKKSNIGLSSISKIIDKFHKYNHIIFIANRLSSRGLSYVSSDYKRHLTFQMVQVSKTTTSFLQKLRILGVYKDNETLNLYVKTDSDVKNVAKHFDKVNASHGATDAAHN